MNGRSRVLVRPASVLAASVFFFCLEYAIGLTPCIRPRPFAGRPSWYGRRCVAGRGHLLMSSEPWIIDSGYEENTFDSTNNGGGKDAHRRVEAGRDYGGGRRVDETGNSEWDAGNGGKRGVSVGSQEFSDLVNAQFDMLASVLNVSQIVLFFRRENIGSGELEFVPVMIYPDRTRMFIVGEDGTIKEAPKELPWSANANKFIPNYPFMSVRHEGEKETFEASVGEDGGLSAPLVYASLVLGVITVWRPAPPSREQEGEQEYVGEGEDSGSEGEEGESRGGEDQSFAEWTEEDRDVLEKVAGSVALAAVLDQRQRWAAAVKVNQIRKVLSETLHQVKNPMTALRTFGKLLLRRLPREDSLNRELARDIILQSDRLVDLLLPVDSVIGQLVAPALPSKLDGLPAIAAAQSQSQTQTGTRTGEIRQPLDRTMPTEDGDVGEAWQGDSKGGGGGEGVVVMIPTSLVFVQDVIEPVTRAAQALAHTRGISFRWRVDEDLPGVVSNERALQEALSNVVENALKYVLMGHEEQGGGEKEDEEGEKGQRRGIRSMVILRARPTSQEDWGRGNGVVIDVVDNGPGVVAEDLPLVFEPGFRGKQPIQSGIPGTGLGLGIARDVMRSMGGDLKLENRRESEWGAGVMFFLPRMPK